MPEPILKRFRWNGCDTINVLFFPGGTAPHATACSENRKSFIDTHSHTTALPQPRGDCGLRDGKKHFVYFAALGKVKRGRCRDSALLSQDIIHIYEV